MFHLIVVVPFVPLALVVADTYVVVEEVLLLDSYVHPVACDVADEDVADEDVADEDVADEDVADKDVADEDVADEDVADEDVADEDVADEDVVLADHGSDTDSKFPAWSFVDSYHGTTCG